MAMERRLPALSFKGGLERALSGGLQSFYGRFYADTTSGP
jgi:hypothetical protein